MLSAAGRELSLRNPKVLQALRDEVARKLTAGAAIGVQTLTDLCLNAQRTGSPVSRELLDRSRAHAGDEPKCHSAG